MCVFLGAQREQGAALREPKSSGPHHHGLSCECFQKALRHRSRFFTFFFCFVFFFYPRSRIDGGVRAKQRQVLFSGRPLRPPRALYQLFALVSSVSDVARCPPLSPRRLSPLLPTTDALVIAVQPRSHGRGCKCHGVREERARLSALTTWVFNHSRGSSAGLQGEDRHVQPQPQRLERLPQQRLRLHAHAGGQRQPPVPGAGLRRPGRQQFVEGFEGKMALSEKKVESK